MQYREFGKTGVKVSALGFGCMRLPVIGGVNTQIEEEEAARMLRTAIDRGVNYVDTAYPYHGGESEKFVGRALQDGYREKVYLASKSPVFSITKEEDFENFLQTQLERLQTDHIDFYLLHALDADRWENVVKKFDLLTKIRRAKEDGRVRHIGFSFHDGAEAFIRILDEFEDCEFCQIQYNYIDVEHQATQKGLEEAARRGLGVVVMEPLLGGKLASPPAQVAKALSPARTPVEWALDFVWHQAGVGPVLSGMSTMQQTLDNLDYASRSSAGMLSGEELGMFAEARRVYETMAFVPCTKCAYCMPCPFGLDMPKIYESYNMSASASPDKALEAYNALAVGADACRQCGKCLGVCPQHIDPKESMAQAAAFFQDLREKKAKK